MLATVSLWILVGQWNDWTTTLYYVTKPKLFPLQTLMRDIIARGQQEIEAAKTSGEGVSSATEVTTASKTAAMIIATSLPIIMVYPFLQKYFVKGVTLGAVKE